jgi:hypothetical protein
MCNDPDADDGTDREDMERPFVNFGFSAVRIVAQFSLGDVVPTVLTRATVLASIFTLVEFA